MLRAQGISHLVLCGIATSGVVLSTLREAADKDDELTVLADGCVDGDEEVQRVLLSKVFPRQADVLFVAAWQARLARRRGRGTKPEQTRSCGSRTVLDGRQVSLTCASIFI